MSQDVGIVLRINTHTKAKCGCLGCLVGEDVIKFAFEEPLKSVANCLIIKGTLPISWSVSGRILANWESR